MTTDNIVEIRIDSNERLLVKPEKEVFDLIYRCACGVGWEKEGNCLFSPKPEKFTYIDWYGQIISAVKSEYGCQLKITSETVWVNIPDDIKSGITNGNIA